MKKIKIGVISYINSLPLWWSLRDCKVVEIYKGKPYEIKKLFLNKEVKFALLPTLDFLEGRYKLAVPLGILSRGKVNSVLLFYRKRINSISKIYLDPESRTSQAMTHYLFKDKGVEFISGVKELNELDEKEAQLLIGDKALKNLNSDFKKVDISELWIRKTKNISIFAIWAKRDEENGDEANILIEAYKSSKNMLDEIIDYARKIIDLDIKILRRYFIFNINYELKEDGLKGLGFYQKIFLHDKKDN